MIKKATKQTIQQAATIIQKGGLVAFPTETVYGLGADALNPQACARIFEAKKRPFFDPLIVHIADWSALEQLCAKVDERAMQLVKRFWPGPLTLVLPKTDAVPDIVTAGLQTVAVRMPAHPVAQELIKAAQTPIAAPSANRFGRLSPTTAEHVQEQIGKNIDLILDGGACSVGVESTIISFAGKAPALLRPGGIAVEEIEQIIGTIHTRGMTTDRPTAPGQLSSHYAPRTPLVILKDDLPEIPVGQRAGLLAFRKVEPDPRFAMVEILSPQGDLREAAVNLFVCLHRLDKARLDVIYAQPVPEEGLGRAIMDRLIRAAGKSRKK